MNLKSVFVTMVFIMVMSFGYNKVTLAAEQTLNNTTQNAKVENIDGNTQANKSVAYVLDGQGKSVVHTPLLGNMSNIAKEATEIVANHKTKTRALGF